MKALIKRLVETFGPAGREEQIRSVIEELMVEYADEIRTDPMGNLICTRKGTGDGASVMLAAHMDEIGFMITHVDKNGFLRFDTVGGISPFTLLGERVTFADGSTGVFGTEKLDKITDLKTEKMFIDAGLTEGGQAGEAKQIGATAVYGRCMDDLGKRLASKAMDDRAGCAVLIQTARNLSNHGSGQLPGDVHFVFTTQEELGARGARTSAFDLEPDIGIAVDLTRTGDTPESARMDVSLGKGPAIKVKDSSIIAHPRVKDMLVDKAEEIGIPYQLEVLERGGTDAGAIHLTRSGIPSGVVSIPGRYIHSPSEMVDVDDVENAVKLLTHLLAGGVKKL